MSRLQDPEDYRELLGALREGGAAGPPAELRRRMAWKAFQHCATYDSTVAEWLWGQIGAYPGSSHPAVLQLLLVRMQLLALCSTWHAKQVACALHVCDHRRPYQ